MRLGPTQPENLLLTDSTSSARVQLTGASCLPSSLASCVMHTFPVPAQPLPPASVVSHRLLVASCGAADFGLSGFLKKSDMSLFVGTPQYMGMLLLLLPTCADSERVTN